MTNNANIEFLRKMNRHVVTRAMKGEYNYAADLKTLSNLYDAALKLKHSFTLGNIALGKGILHFMAGYPSEAIAAYALAIEHGTAPDVDNPYVVVAALSNQAETYMVLGQFDKTVQASEEALTYLDTMSDEQRRGSQFNTWSVLASALLWLGRYDDVRDYAAKIIDATPPSDEIAQSNYLISMMSIRRTLAELALIERDHEAAISQARLLLDYDEIENNVIEAAVSYLTMAHIAERTQATQHPPQYYYDLARQNADRIPNLGKRAYLFLEEARYCKKNNYNDRAMRLVSEVKDWFVEAENGEGGALAATVLED